MTVNAMNQSAMLPQADRVLLANSNPLLGAAPGQAGAGMPMAMAMPMAEKPSLGARLVNAVKAAISELRGVQPNAAQLGAQQLGLGAPMASLAGAPAAAAPVTVKKRGVSAKNMTPEARRAVMDRVKQEKAEAAKAGAAAPTAVAGAAMPTAATGAVASTALPAHATQLPGATVYSYDGNGNPAVAGLQGLSPQMQSQLGMDPTMLGAVNGLVNSVDPSPVPQVNATNQNNIGHTGLMGASSTPVLGAPIAQPVAEGDAAAGAGRSNQSVTNANSNERSALNQDPYGSYGSQGYGMSSPYSQYGTSMTGSYPQGGISGFFNRLFG